MIVIIVFIPVLINLHASASRMYMYSPSTACFVLLLSDFEDFSVESGSCLLLGYFT